MDNILVHNRTTNDAAVLNRPARNLFYARISFDINVGGTALQLAGDNRNRIQGEVAQQLTPTFGEFGVQAVVDDPQHGRLVTSVDTEREALGNLEDIFQACRIALSQDDGMDAASEQRLGSGDYLARKHNNSR